MGLHLLRRDYNGPAANSVGHKIQFQTVCSTTILHSSSSSAGIIALNFVAQLPCKRNPICVALSFSAPVREREKSTIGKNFFKPLHLLCINCEKRDRDTHSRRCGHYRAFNNSDMKQPQKTTINS